MNYARMYPLLPTTSFVCGSTLYMLDVHVTCVDASYGSGAVYGGIMYLVSESPHLTSSTPRYTSLRLAQNPIMTHPNETSARSVLSIQPPG